MKKSIITFLALLLSLSVAAQWKWHNPMDAGFPVVQNQAFPEETGKSYARLPERAQQKVTKDVWALSRNSSGLALYFRTDAKEIRVRYTVGGGRSMIHMPATGVSGVDLYRIDAEGDWQRCWGRYSFGDTITYTFKSTVANKRYGRGYEFRLYLPLYNSVKWLEIGTPQDAAFEFMPVEPEKPIVVYGTSIAQGACASRPGMAWTTILQRRLDYPLINLGFSGNGLLAPGITELMGETDARIYILDCMPNLTGRSAEEVENLAYNAVRKLRESKDTPILLVEHIGYSNMKTDTAAFNDVERTNAALRRAFNRLQAEGKGSLHYLSADEIGMTTDCWVDYIHPSDLGMKRQADAVEKKLRDILHIPAGTCPTTTAVTQRRDVNSYEWRKRHQDILRHTDSIAPRKVIIGNSISHYWGGEPSHRKKSGSQSWAKYMEPAGFVNMGCGWDRIENMLWRVYHDELDGFKAEEVVVLAGTNNLDFNTDEEIVLGIATLTDAIAYRQPEAVIKIIGILPRRGKEIRIRGINRQLSEMAREKKVLFSDPGRKLLLPDGKIDEHLFGDGLHPNQNGYSLIAPEISGL